VTSDDNSKAATRAAQKRRVGLALALVGVLAIFAAWWWHAHGSFRFASYGPPDQKSKLDALLTRERTLKGELDALSAAQRAHCPPGFVAEQTPSTLADADGQKLTPLSSKEMVEKLERATVLVLLPNSKGLATGTGFFISPQHLITNRHVVESTTDGRVLLASRTLKRIRTGTVIAVTDNSKPGSPDFALIRLETGQAPGSLEINTEPTKLSEVIAAGYPGLVMRGDASFMRLVRDGDLSAAPDLSLTRGTIQSIQDSFSGTPIIVHTASILQGNSGGPLVDACGRVVGVNTFIAVDQQQSGRVSYAIQAHTMGAFADRQGGAVTRDRRPCG
jgi:S1-C subfamily serine protease